jgi:hypothetical protein
LASAALAAALSLALWLNFTSPWSPRHPRAVEPLYVVDEGSGHAWRVSPFEPDPWTESVLKADGGKIGLMEFPAFRHATWAAPAHAEPIPAPAIDITKAADGTIAVHAAMTPSATLLLDLRTDTVVTGGAVDGKSAPILDQPGKWTHLLWQAAPGGVTAAFKPVGHGALDIRYAEFTPAWPAAARPLPPMPADLMAWDMSGSEVATRTLRSNW